MTHWLSKYWKWPAAGLGLIALSVAASFLPFAQWIETISGWVETLGPFGVVGFALVYAVATLLFMPGSVLTISAGLIFGVVLGMLAAWSGAVLGASLAFLVGRYLARSKIEQQTKNNEKFQALDEAIGKRGWKIIALLRLSPLIPFNISNYFYGITKVGFWPYVLASAAGMLPGTLLYVYLGAVGKAGVSGGGAEQHSPLQYVFFGIGLLVTIGVTIWVSRIAKQALTQSGAIKGDAKK